ncbi:MAG: GntR family transcriptional regulator [Scrofimicrobium sp.]
MTTVKTETSVNHRGSTVDRAYHRIRQLIEEKQLRPHDRIPSEIELSDQLNISRSSLREALSRLEQEGVLTVVQGHGRFVSTLTSLRVERPMTVYESITEMLEGLGYAVTSAVLEVEEIGAPEIVATPLEIQPGDPVVRVLRIRYGDNKPLVISEGFIPRELLPGPLEHRDWSGSVARILAMQGHRVESSLAVISAVNLPEEWEDRYNLAELGPWLLTDEICLTKTGKPVMFARDYHRGTDITYRVLRNR